MPPSSIWYVIDLLCVIAVVPEMGKILYVYIYIEICLIPYYWRISCSDLKGTTPTMYVMAHPNISIYELKK